MPPPNVQLPKQQADQGSGPREAPQNRRDDGIGEGSQDPVEQHARIERQHRVIPIRAAPIVMRSQMQPKPRMLRNVIKKCRGKVADDEGDGDARDGEEDA